MLKFPSPLSGFSTPFGTHGALSAYAVGSFEPEFVLDFEQEYYRTGGTATTFSGAVSFSRISNATYVDSTGTLQTAAPGVARVGHHVYNGSAWVNEGVLVESEARTNLLLNSGTLATQNVTVTAQAYTLHFTGTGTVTLSGASTAGPLVGTGTGENNRVNLTFTPTAGTLALTVSGTVTNAQLEAGSTPSSYIPTSGATVTRAAETLTVPAANLPWSSDAVSLQMQGQMTYVDDGDNATATFVRWQAISGQYIQKRLRTDSTRTGASYALMNNGVATIGQDTNGAVADLSAGINVPFNTASRFGSTFLNVALDGVAASALSTPTALPDLSSTDLQLGYDYMGTIKLFRIWANDLGDAGIAEAST